MVRRKLDITRCISNIIAGGGWILLPYVGRRDVLISLLQLQHNVIHMYVPWYNVLYQTRDVMIITERLINSCYRLLVLVGRVAVSGQS